MKSVDRAVREEVLPKIEHEMSEMLDRLIKSKRIQGEKEHMGYEVEKVEEEDIRSIVVEEFA